MKIPVIEKIKRIPKQTEESLKDAFNVLLSLEDRREADEYVKWIREEAKKLRSASMYELIRNTYFYAGQYNFDSFMIGMEWNREPQARFWIPRRKVLEGKHKIATQIHSTNAKAGAADWQKTFYDACIKHTGLKGNRATPLAKSALYECGAPNCPSVLMELGFMDSTVDVPIILTDDYATKIAKALADVIVERCGAKKKASNGAVVTLPILIRNSRGESVRALQSLLNMHGAKLSVDGSFGPATEKAAKAFQTKNGFSVDGKCGVITWSALLT